MSDDDVCVHVSIYVTEVCEHHEAQTEMQSPDARDIYIAYVIKITENKRNAWTTPHLSHTPHKTPKIKIKNKRKQTTQNS